MTSQSKNAGNSPAAANELFKRPRPLDRIAHQALTINRQAGFGFARGQIAIPITLSEFAAAARDYPIVFAGDPAQPFALLGLRDGHNLLVDAAGQWRKERYVPAHLRRYPFIFMETPDKQFVLCIDEAAEHFAAPAQGEPQPLFADGKPTPLVGDAMKFLAAFQSEFGATRELAAAIAASGLLIERQAEVELSGGAGHFSVGGFRIVDEEALAALADETFLDWRRRGWLAPIYFHLQSLANFGLLTEWAGQESTAA
ncbi:MAG: SapC family protein [Rhodocyclaceae bacterium]|nr:SapC family protein [Rhodocyclaceae bacterium]